jgi:quercetin dioxygenase-like cupin family protein
VRSYNWGKISDLEKLDASSLAPSVTKRNIFGPDAFWEDYVMRHFILPENSEINPHSHDWDHLVLSLAGHGEVEVEGERYDLDLGNWARVPAGKTHSFRNIGAGDFAFICIVPTHGDPHAKKTAMREDRRRRQEASAES